MSYADKQIIQTYSGLFEGLSSTNKMELIESLSKSLRIEKSAKEDRFYRSFGAFSAGKSAELIVEDIKSHRKFRNKVPAVF